MTDITLEQRARQLLAAEYERDGFPCHAQEVREGHGQYKREVRAIEAALRLSAGAEWVLVPAVADEGMLVAGLKVADPIGELIDWQADEMRDPATREDAQRIYLAMLAAAPRHEPGEGS